MKTTKDQVTQILTLEQVLSWVKENMDEVVGVDGDCSNCLIYNYLKYFNIVAFGVFPDSYKNQRQKVLLKDPDESSFSDILDCVRIPDKLAELVRTLDRKFIRNGYQLPYTGRQVIDTYEEMRSGTIGFVTFKNWI